MLLGNEVNPSIKPVVVDSLNYLQSMKALMSNSTVEEDVKCKSLQSPLFHTQ